MEGLLILDVQTGSIAEELDIESGDRLIAVNGSKLRDIVDYHFFTDENNLALELIKTNGEVWEIEVEREEGEQLGMVFAPPKPRKCKNNCIFCFVHQMPPGLRQPLYVKDEDYLLSFLCGNYVTMSDITLDEINRIIEQHLSPLYVSVHASEPVLRDRLLGRRHPSKPILDILNKLSAAHITIHTQIVLCPGINDGPALHKTVYDLAALHPSIASLAIVPVGLTKHRNGLLLLSPVTREYAVSFLKVWQPLANNLNRKLNNKFLMFADEFYIKAGNVFPPLSSYGNMPQLENGVGMIPLFLREARNVLRRAKRCKAAQITIVTGESPYIYLKDFIAMLAEKTGTMLHLIAVNNKLFGDEVTVTGLVSGQDIISTLRGLSLGDLVIIPDVMLKEGEGVFIDDMSIDDMQKELNVKVQVVASTPQGIYALIKRLNNI